MTVERYATTYHRTSKTFSCLFENVSVAAACLLVHELLYGQSELCTCTIDYIAQIMAKTHIMVKFVPGVKLHAGGDENMTLPNSGLSIKDRDTLIQQSPQHSECFIRVKLSTVCHLSKRSINPILQRAARVAISRSYWIFNSRTSLLWDVVDLV